MAEKKTETKISPEDMYAAIVELGERVARIESAVTVNVPLSSVKL